jgi:hypothetical protein
MVVEGMAIDFRIFKGFGFTEFGRTKSLEGSSTDFLADRMAKAYCSDLILVCPETTKSEEESPFMHLP